MPWEERLFRREIINIQSMLNGNWDVMARVTVTVALKDIFL
jgi:hypothetical protein